jgi:hypothetical protein
MGDSIMALFGAPVSYEDNARRAVTTALDMIDALDSIDMCGLVLPEGLTFNIGIGIHYGDVIVGSIGCTDKSDYTVIGDSVNLTSRIESLTKQYGARIIITEPVKAELDSSFNLRLLDNVKVKGKSVPVSVYAVLERGSSYPEDYQENYHKAMDLYRAGAWNLAMHYFNQAAEVCPSDKAARIMTERCRQFAEKPPQNWDGAVSLTSK